VKPVLVLPEDAVEQRLNAVAVQDMRIGMAGSLERLTTARVLEFLEHLEHYRGHMRRRHGDGREAAIEKLLGFIEELSQQAPRRLPLASRALRALA
jgi:hypothetical protein